MSVHNSAALLPVRTVGWQAALHAHLGEERSGGGGLLLRERLVRHEVGLLRLLRHVGRLRGAERKTRQRRLLHQLRGLRGLRILGIHVVRREISSGCWMSYVQPCHQQCCPRAAATSAKSQHSGLGTWTGPCLSLVHGRSEGVARRGGVHRGGLLVRLHLTAKQEALHSCNGER